MLNEMRLSRRRGKLPASGNEGGEMAGAEQHERLGLSDEEKRVLEALQHAERAVDIVELASASRLDVDTTFDVVRGLEGKGLVAVRPPEEIRTRVEVGNELQKLAS